MAEGGAGTAGSAAGQRAAGDDADEALGDRSGRGGPATDGSVGADRADGSAGSAQDRNPEPGPDTGDSPASGPARDARGGSRRDDSFRNDRFRDSGDRSPRRTDDRRSERRSDYGSTGAGRGGRPERDSRRGAPVGAPPGFGRPGQERRRELAATATVVDEPPLTAEITPSQLDAEVRRDLRGLQKETAERVARHLVAAGSLVDVDPELALQHARYARFRASRIAVVREAAGIAAYHAGEWSEALGELRAARRMGGGPGHLAVMADIERALGRPERALDLIRGPEAAELDRAERIELAIVASGARRDLGELDASVIGLQIPELDAARRDPWSARLFYAYADNLLAAGRESDALEWFVYAARADEGGETDAEDRIAELTGEESPDDGIEFVEDDDRAGPDADGAGPEAERSASDQAAGARSPQHDAEAVGEPATEGVEPSAAPAGPGVASGETAVAAGPAPAEPAGPAGPTATDGSAPAESDVPAGPVTTDAADDVAPGALSGDPAVAAGPASAESGDSTDREVTDAAEGAAPGALSGNTVVAGGPAPAESDGPAGEVAEGGDPGETAVAVQAAEPTPAEPTPDEEAPQR